MKLFLSAQERTKKRNEKHIAQLKRAVDVRKAEFRNNAISKLTFLYPDMEFAMGMTSDQFAGYSPKENIFVSGEFLDQYLPEVSRITDRALDADFEKHAGAFARDIRSLTFESDLPEAVERRVHERNVKDFLSRRADHGYTFDDRFFPYDIRIKKNGRVIGRSSSQSPKPIGYFAEKSYAHVVEDTHGTGVSNFSIELLLWNYGDLIEQEIAFIYIDTPRKSVSQMRDHYIKTCAQFVPFLQAAERFLHDPEWRNETSGMGFIKSDRELGLR
jgi:hypothetical protein